MAAPTHGAHASPSMPVMFGSSFEVDGAFPDIILVSSDSAIFHAHRHRLLAASSNSFGRLLVHTPRSRLVLREPADVLNIVLHLIYGASCLYIQPPLQSTEAALDALIAYGVSGSDLSDSQSLHQLLLAYAPYYPIESYAIAARFGLENIAAAISSHLLSYDLKKVTDALTIKMGPIYFRRLYHLQRTRLDALRNIALRPPPQHPPNEACEKESQQQALSRAWAFASADLAWSALPSTSVGALQSTFMQAGASITCPDCQKMLCDRIQEVTAEWSAVKRTI